MKFPTSLKFKNRVYKIEYVKDNREVSNYLESEGYNGVINHVDKIIRVYINREIYESFDTLLHEILHGIFQNNKMLQAKIRDQEEDFVATLATELAFFLIENGLKLSNKIPITRRLNDASA